MNRSVPQKSGHKKIASFKEDVVSGFFGIFLTVALISLIIGIFVQRLDVMIIVTILVGACLVVGYIITPYAVLDIYEDKLAYKTYVAFIKISQKEAFWWEIQSFRQEYVVKARTLVISTKQWKSKRINMEFFAEIYNGTGSAKDILQHPLQNRHLIAEKSFFAYVKKYCGKTYHS